MHNTGRNCITLRWRHNCLRHSLFGNAVERADVGREIWGRNCDAQSTGESYFGGVTFLAPGGGSFWSTAGMLHCAGKEDLKKWPFQKEEEMLALKMLRSIAPQLGIWEANCFKRSLDRWKHKVKRKPMQKRHQSSLHEELPSCCRNGRWSSDR